MAKFCEVCGRGGMVGNTRSHSNVASKTKRQVNLQTKRVDGMRFRACTRCLKTAAKYAAAV